MNAASITTSTFRLRAAGSTADVPATVRVNTAGPLATPAASSPLAAGTVYTATVAAAVTDTIGTALGADSLWSFTTDVAPTVTAQAPAHRESGVAGKRTDTGTLRMTKKNDSINTSTFRLRAAGSTADVPATVTVNAAGTLATLTPSSPLAAGTVYTATVAAAVTDTSGTALSADSLWSFTTDVAPTVTAQAPAPGASVVNYTATTKTTSLTPHNAPPITTSTFRLRAAGSTADVPATVTVNTAGTLATLTPSSPLAAGTVYTATVAAAVTEIGRTSRRGRVQISVVAESLTKKNEQAPAPGRAGVPLRRRETATYREGRTAASSTASTFRLRAAGSTADVPATVTVNTAGTLATLTPSSPLAAGTVYTATVAAAVTDTISTAHGAASLQSLSDDVSPTLTAQAPAPRATCVPLNTTVTAT